MNRLPLRALTLAAVAAFVGCETHYAYVPTTSAVQIAGGRVAADYAIPPEAPHGRAQIVSYGLVDVSPGDATAEERLRALHVRLIVTNSADREWSIDTRDQRLDLDGRGISAPAFASADPGTPPPLVTIAPGTRRVVDLFFPVPADLADADELPSFDALWRVSTGTSVVVERTPFERLIAEPSEDYAGADYGVDYYWGPPYWYNPLYPHYAFGGVVIVPRNYVGHPVVVHRPPPHVHYRGTRR